MDLAGDSAFQGRHSLRFQHAAVDIAEHMPKPKVLAERPGKIPVDNSRSDLGDVERHVIDQVPVPLVPSRNTAVELARDAQKDAFNAVVEIVQNRAASPQGIDVVLLWGIGSSSPKVDRLASSDSISAASRLANTSFSFTARPCFRLRRDEGRLWPLPGRLGKRGNR